MNYSEAMTRDLRLCLLQGLSKMTDHRLSDRMLLVHVENEGHRRSLDAVRTEMRALAERGALKLVIDTSAVLVAEITRSGLDHVSRRGVIEGVGRPEPGA